MMSRTTLRRGLAAAAVAALLPTAALTTAAPAQAGSMFFSKSSGKTIHAEWLEVGPLPGVEGNFHFGSMEVEVLTRGRANVFGSVFDMTCPPGVVPSPPGGHGEVEQDACVVHEPRFVSATDATRVTMDRAFTRATVTGTLAVFGHEGGQLGSPTVAMTLTGVGDTFSSVSSERYSDGTSTYSYSYRFSGRAATISGSIGPMIFDDEEGEYSFAQMGAYRSASRSRTS